MPQSAARLSLPNGKVGARTGDPAPPALHPQVHAHVGGVCTRTAGVCFTLGPGPSDVNPLHYRGRLPGNPPFIHAILYRGAFVSGGSGRALETNTPQVSRAGRRGSLNVRWVVSKLGLPWASKEQVTASPQPHGHPLTSAR